MQDHVNIILIIITKYNYLFLAQLTVWVIQIIFSCCIYEREITHMTESCFQPSSHFYSLIVHVMYKQHDSCIVFKPQ